MDVTARLLAIDQGTTSSRAILFRPDGSVMRSAQRELPQQYPRSGWVEHDPIRIWEDTLAVCREVLGAAGEDSEGDDADGVIAIGITNQRETTVVWDRESGQPVHPAIVWQDRRTADYCRALRRDGHEDMVTERTGLLLDPYFSATKIRWILENVDGARARAERGELAAGTVDCWLLWNLTKGQVHATDVTNASRTMLLDIRSGQWDDQLLNLFEVPRAMLPAVTDSAGELGATDPEWFGQSMAIRGIAGDQQAATFGQAAFEPGTMKSTYGTGCFALLNTGDRLIRSEHRMLGTVAWGLDGVRTYALEGSIFIAGAAVQWLRDGLGIIETAAETEELARSIDDTGGVYMVPAFTGLGAPYWDADARGALLGLTRDAGPAQIARAALEAVAYQTRDLLEAMRGDGAALPGTLRVDGGFTANDWAMQRLADTLGVPVERPVVTETTALGAAYLAGLASGVFDSTDEIADNWKLDRRFEPELSQTTRDAGYAGWKDAVSRVRTDV